MTERDGVEGGTNTGLLERIQQNFKHQTTRNLRVAPQQPRAWQTVERLLDATNRLMLLTRTFDELNLEMAAADAGVTPQSAYRYFANIGDLVRTSVRRMQANWNARFVEFMLCQTFETRSDVAHAIAGFIAETYGSQVTASTKLIDEIFRHYHDLDYDAAWIVSDTIVSSVGAACTPRMRVGEMATGLTALWAIAKFLILRDARELSQRNVHDLMAAVLLAALNGSAPLDGEASAEPV
jgi:AcrR family transcriptional regulator